MRALCFYLPQFHPIPENDAWWGRGFTEWTNVARARPRFPGHHQPQVPADLGFYDLRLDEARVAQAALAEEHGIGGFCYYHYWFNGRQLLERPFDEVLASGRPGLPFCLCWANGNWTRRWDGADDQVLMQQDYDAYDAQEHLAWLARAFADPRYVRVHGRPLFLVYRTDAIPDLAGTVAAWRRAAARLGIDQPYLCAVQSPGNVTTYAECIAAGFDAVTEFYPTGRNPARGGRGAARAARLLRAGIDRVASRTIAALGRGRLNLQRYPDVVDSALETPLPERCFPCVMPGWDNSARRRDGATVIQNDDAGLYQRWLEAAIDRVADRPADERIVFINAWNEWAEGCHLEPDLRNGRRFLEATRAALLRAGRAPVPRPEARPRRQLAGRSG